MEASDFTEDKNGELVRNLNGDLCFVASPLPKNLRWTDEIVTALSEAERALGQLVGIGQQFPSPQLLVRSSLRREAELSSRIEGTQASLTDLVLYDQTQSADERAPDVREVDNNFRTLEWGLQQLKHRPISLGLIREMHQILMKDVRGEEKNPGQFRSNQAHIGRSKKISEARFVPAPPHAILPAMEQLEQFVQSRGQLPPLARAAMIHYQFEAIHPFADGNGRIGRVLILLLLCAEGVLPIPLLNPSAFLERNRDEYYRHLLDVSQRGMWTDWVTFFAKGVAEEAIDATSRVQDLNRLREKYYRMFQKARASALLPKLVDQLFINPAITTSHAREVLGVTFNSAQKAIDWFLAKGIVTEWTGQKRNRLYVATKILAAIEGKSQSNAP